MRIGGLPLHVARAYGVQPARAAALAPQGVQSLVAGALRQPIDLERDTSGASPANGALQLYTRAADKVEAAVAVRLGCAVDVKG